MHTIPRPGNHLWQKAVFNAALMIEVCQEKGVENLLSHFLVNFQYVPLSHYKKLMDEAHSLVKQRLNEKVVDY